MTRRVFRIGTAGWNVPRTESGFPEHGSHLERYSAVFSAVEINSSFYRPHRRKTYERWAASVPESFQFSVKVPKAITHESRLFSAESLIEQFLEEVGGLGRKLGALLVQLPPTLRLDEELASRFFEGLRERTTVSVVCEPRHRTWFTSTAESLLERYQIARVAADPAVVPDAARPAGHNRTIYYRLHGSPRVYYSAYQETALQEIAQRMEERRRTEAVWCIFDNTAEQAAIPDARKLMALLEG